MLGRLFFVDLIRLILKRLEIQNPKSKIQIPKFKIYSKSKITNKSQKLNLLKSDKKLGINENAE